MTKRRRVPFLTKLIGSLGVSGVGTILLALASVWGFRAQSVKSDAVLEDAQAGSRRLWAHVVAVEASRDSLRLRVSRLEREARSRGATRAPGIGASGWEGPPDPGVPPKRGTLLRSLFGWLPG